MTVDDTEHLFTLHSSALAIIQPGNAIKGVGDRIAGADRPEARFTLVHFHSRAVGN